MTSFDKMLLSSVIKVNKEIAYLMQAVHQGSAFIFGGI